jgi:hypothetical protein
MATQFPNVDELEQAAAYRPSVGANILNLLTGGIYGGVTGKSQKAMEAAAARQVLLQERAQERGMERALFRNKMQTALEEGLQIPEGARKEDLDALIQQNRIKRLREELRGFTGEDPAPDLSIGEMTGRLSRVRSEIPQRVAQEIQGKRDIELLKALQGRGVIPSPVDVSRLSPEAAKAQVEVYEPQYRESIRTDASQRQELREVAAIDAWRKETETDVPDQKKLMEIFPRLPDTYQKDPAIRSQVGLLNTISTDERKNLRELTSGYSKGVQLIGSIQKLVGEKDYNQVSAMSFNSLESWRRNQGQALFQQSPEWNQINEITQEFEDYMAGRRKNLFGASLTGTELESAKNLYGNKNSANFLPTLIGILDRQFAKDSIKEDYEDLGLFVPDALKKSVQNKRNEYLKIRSTLSAPSLEKPAAPAAPAPQPARPAGSSRGGLTPEQRAAAERRVNELLQKQQKQQKP